MEKMRVKTTRGEKQKKTPSPRQSVMLGVRVSVETLAGLAKMAAEQKMYQSEYVRKVLEHALKTGMTFALVAFMMVQASAQVIERTKFVESKDTTEIVYMIRNNKGVTPYNGYRVTIYNAVTDVVGGIEPDKIELYLDEKFNPIPASWNIRRCEQ